MISGIVSLKILLPASSLGKYDNRWAVISKQSLRTFDAIHNFETGKIWAKFWLVVGLRKKYLLDAFSYLGKSEECPSDQALSEYLVVRYMQPFLNGEINVTFDISLTPFHLAKELKNEGTS